MLELLLKLIEQLTKLVDIREKNREEYFQRYVQPTYVTAEAIYSDYRSLLRKLRGMLVQRRSSKAIIDFLEERREELLPARDRLRALVVQRSNEGRLTRFEAGVLGVMTGASTATDRPHFRTVTYNENDGAIRALPAGHTVLDLLQSMKAEGSRSSAHSRQFMLKMVDLKMDGIEEAWRNVTSGYAELQASALPATKVPKSQRLNRGPDR
jgi:hypothetical protein